MLIAQLPTDEELRLQDLFSYDILDSESEKEFNDLVELAGQICHCPMSMITFIERDRQWFKARLDPGPRETTRDEAFCAHAILQSDVMIVEDARLDERFHDNPNTLDPTSPVRFYAGAPIVSPTGYNLGTLCVIHNEPRKLTVEQERALEILSAQITRLLELRAKNKRIRNRAEQIIDLKDKTVNAVLADQDQQQQQIAEQLHEQIAQEAAACKLFIRMAEDSEEQRSDYLHTANTYLEQIINDLRKLSNKINPSVLLSIPVEDLLIDHVRKLNEEVSFELKLKVTGSSVALPVEKTVMLFRIFEKWVQVLKKRSAVQQVNIHLVLTDRIELAVEDDGEKKDFSVAEKEIVAAGIDARVRKAGGTIKLVTGISNGNILSIEIPV
ncbi:GAF domain-containing protein [Lacibacter luteus]|uniref:GAF domain-containing protein n=1 Tax=Lacibacter luteus TaxID=2508719 RepID=A0A4Q1CM30_9BACT|nr:GAF domain-containing protein [Lacibacter luteus]RXK62066.1 GAF domain-containing protein [Lacibacter luteus]